ncbi:MAG: cation:proton antiporter [Propionibacteriaceae bacterium]|jgi:CPA1 family monovalent cation:H+ antiporter|nr:cation:proton antiporter [Propionibacteriaceae bacterium]
MEYLILAVVAVALIVGLTSLGSRLGVAPPLILVAVGVIASFLPWVTPIVLPPEVVLAGVLPPLLYSAAVSMPVVEFRRDLVAIGGLSVALVGLTALVAGLVFNFFIPGIGLPIGIALGAILSPTDAVAIRIAKGVGLPRRVVAILEGEALINDATTLILLRSALAAAATAVSFWGVAIDFLRSAVIAIIIGALVGWLGIVVRRRITATASDTVVSFLIPFVAYIPCEELHASGLVAVVVAGLVSRQLAPHHISAQHRITESANWHTVEFLLEGSVFLLMGWEVSPLIADARAQGSSLPLALWMALLGVALTLAIRALFVSGLVWQLIRTATRKVQRRDSWRSMGEALGVDAHDPESWSVDDFGALRAATRTAGLVNETGGPPLRRHLRDKGWERAQERWDSRPDRPGSALEPSPDRPEATAPRKHFGRDRRLNRSELLHVFRTRLQTYFADVDYLVHQPIGGKEGAVLVWAGMRGVVTLAAAQTLPVTTPHRSLLILIAFGVASLSLLLQGGTLAVWSRRLGLTGRDQARPGEATQLDHELGEAALRALDDPDLAQPDGQPYDPKLIALTRLRLHVTRIDQPAPNPDDPDQPDALAQARADIQIEEDDDETALDTAERKRQYRQLRRLVIRAMREALLEARAIGAYSTGVLADALTQLDASEISLDIRGQSH